MEMYTGFGEDTLEMHVRYRYIKGSVFCIFRYFKYRSMPEVDTTFKKVNEWATWDLGQKESREGTE